MTAALDALTTTPHGWATYPLALGVGLLLAALAVLIGVRVEHQRAERRHAEVLAEARRGRELEAQEIVDRYLRCGWTHEAIRRECHGGRPWCAAIDRALERRGPTGTQRSAPARGDA